MAGRLFRTIWQALNPDMELSKTLTGGVEAGRSVLELADALQKNQNLKELKPILDKIDSVIDAMNLPLGEVAKKRGSFLPIATSILKYVVKQTGRELTLPDSVELVSQVAYLESLSKFLRDRPEIQLQEKEASAELARYIQKFAKKIKFDDNRARETLICFHKSLLARELNKVLQARLVESGLEEELAATVTERVSRSTHRYMKEAVAAVKDDAQQLAGIYEDGWERDLERYNNIDKYLQDVIAKKPTEKVFDHEEFTFQDIYVPLEVRSFDFNERVDRLAAPENIEDWAKRILLDEEKSDRPLFVRASPRRGKSVFCRMFADLVRRELHPIYTPILIPLGDVYRYNIGENLRNALVDWDFATRDKNWLRDCNTRFLFLLDGFLDELRLQRWGTYRYYSFLEDLLSFQADNKWEHRLLITVKSLPPLPPPDIEDSIPLRSLESVSIAPMYDALQQHYLDKWQAVAAVKTDGFREFLRHENCPQRVKELAREPLLLYLLAAMHRDGKLEVEMFANMGRKEAMALVYERALEWVSQKETESVFGKAIARFIGGANLTDADLSNADLTDANLTRANLSGANLADANFTRANLSGANFLDANFCNVNFRDANLSDADLSGVNISYADLSGVNLSGANLSGADLNYEETQDRSIGANLQGVNLKGANLSGARLCGVNISYADLTGANLRDADLYKAWLNYANLSDTDFRGVFLDAFCYHANFTRANLSGASIAIDLKGANLSGANLSNIKWNKMSSVIGLHEAKEVPEALKQEPEFAAAVVLSRGYAQAKEGKIEEAIASYQEAQTLNPQLEISARFWSHLCWYGCLHNRAADVLFAGEKAVELEKPDEDFCKEWEDYFEGNEEIKVIMKDLSYCEYRGTRGLARALTGDVEGAIADFQDALDSPPLPRSYFSYNNNAERRQRWLEALRRGENPFTPKELAALRRLRR